MSLRPLWGNSEKACDEHCLNVAAISPQTCNSVLLHMSRNGPVRFDYDDGDAASSSGQGLRITTTVSVHKTG
jgi:hypothetical protein